MAEEDKKLEPTGGTDTSGAERDKTKDKAAVETQSKKVKATTTTGTKTKVKATAEPEAKEVTETTDLDKNKGTEVKDGELDVPTTKEREEQHKELKTLVSQYEEMGEQLTTPITVDADKVKINPFDDTDAQKQLEQDQQTEFEWTKWYMDSQVLSASSALRINSVADLGSQVKMNYETLMPVQHQLAMEQEHYQFLNDQVNNSRQLAQIALKQQQASAVISVQQLNQKLNLELGTSRQNMETQITTMLNVYNQYESSLNDLVLSKNNIANQQKIIDNKKQSSHKSWWEGLTAALPAIMMGAVAGGFGLRGVGAVGKFALAEGETGGLAAKLAYTAEESEGFKSGLARVGASALKGGFASRSIGGLFAGAVSLGMFFH